MSDRMAQETIQSVTGYQRPKAQMQKLAELGYIVLGRDARGRVVALETHPRDPEAMAASGGQELATLKF